MERRYRVYPQFRREKELTRAHGSYWNEADTPIVHDGLRFLEADDGFTHWWPNDRLQVLEDEDVVSSSEVFSPWNFSDYPAIGDLLLED